MQVLLLGGYSARNKPWIYEVADALEPLAEQRVVHEYAHWNDESKSLDAEAELTAIADEAQNLAEYVVFAKSVGCLLAVEGMHRGLLAPQACVFAGLPLDTAVRERGEAFARQIAAVNCPLVFVQNSDDPLGSYKDVKAYLEHAGAVRAMAVELPGETHDYSDTATLKTIVRGVLQ